MSLPSPGRVFGVDIDDFQSRKTKLREIAPTKVKRFDGPEILGNLLQSGFQGLPAMGLERLSNPFNAFGPFSV